jgi:hypothetical protein
MMLTPSGSNSVAESSEVLFEDCLHDPIHRQLNYFVFQRSDAERPFRAVSLWYPSPLRWQSTIPAAMRTIVQVGRKRPIPAF